MYLAEIIKKFAPQTAFGVPVAENIEEIAQRYLELDNFIYIEEPGKGAILGLVFPHWWNPQVLVAQELGWWVEPEYRGTTLAIRLLNKLEVEAKRKGATKLLMICLEAVEPDKVESIYLRKGYTKLERIFSKDLTWQ